MRIGEFLVSKNYISQKALDEALESQKKDKELRIGEILINNGNVAAESLNEYFVEFLEQNEEASMEEATQWLNQEQADTLFSKYKNPGS